jgi:hypothetical protein
VPAVSPSSAYVLTPAAVVPTAAHPAVPSFDRSTTYPVSTATGSQLTSMRVVEAAFGLDPGGRLGHAGVRHRVRRTSCFGWPGFAQCSLTDVCPLPFW